MGKSLWQLHKEVVAELFARGEPIWNPTQRTMLHSIDDVPDVYAKGVPYPSKDLIIGAGLKEKDGTYSILGEHCTWHSTGYSIEQLGLCDPVVFYENANLLNRIKEAKDNPLNNVCPCCGRPK
jgi:hypothetical protein